MGIIFKSLISAAATAIILIVSKIAGPRIAGAIGGLPIVFAVSYIFLTLDDKSVANQFLAGGIYGSAAAIFFSVILIWLNMQFVKTHCLNFVVAYLASFFLALALTYFVKK